MDRNRSSSWCRYISFACMGRICPYPQQNKSMTAAQWVITIGAVISSLGIIYRSLIRPIYKWMQRIEKAVSIVEQNMGNNGGSSLRDAIDRIENRLTLVEDHITRRT